MRREGKRSIERADRISWALLIFGVARMAAWTLMMVFTGLGAAGITTFAWAKDAASLVLFVSFISYYANWATDLDAVTAAWAAVRAGKAHAQVVSGESTDLRGFAAVLRRIEATNEMVLEELRRQEGGA